jgi:hypothetical protein
VECGGQWREEGRDAAFRSVAKLRRAKAFGRHSNHSNPLYTTHGSAKKADRPRLSSPDKLQYLIKRDLSTNTVEASLRIKATTSKTQFKLLASGLNATTDYFLVLNGAIVQKNSTDAKGRLLINSLLENPGDILDLRSVAVWDSTSNSVLSTTSP